VRRRLVCVVIAMLAVLSLGIAAAPAAERVVVPKPGAATVCPVCGMFVTKFPEWTATVVYRDGHAHFFDGAKDMFKYLADLPRYAPGHRADDIVTIAVMDYYDVEPIDAKMAFYVIGSDVYGPMGRDLVPLATRSEAEEFLKDHHGSSIVRFEQVSRGIIESLDRGEGN